MAYENKEIYETLELVYSSLQEMGYRPLDQLTGYLYSKDPSYITARNGARKKICEFEIDEIILELLKAYLKK